MTQADRPREDGGRQQPDRGRRPYRRPQLTEYGSVAKLTQSGGTAATDFMGMAPMTCL